MSTDLYLIPGTELVPDTEQTVLGLYADDYEVSDNAAVFLDELPTEVQIGHAKVLSSVTLPFYNLQNSELVDNADHRLRSYVSALQTLSAVQGSDFSITDKVALVRVHFTALEK